MLQFYTVRTFFPRKNSTYGYHASFGVAAKDAAEAINIIKEKLEDGRVDAVSHHGAINFMAKEFSE